MILTGNEDLRVQKTVSAIQSTFKQLLLEKPYEKITVRELAERARINKKTFYRYYETLDYLLAELQGTYQQAYLDRTRGLRVPEDTEAITRAFILFSCAQDEVYERITCDASFARMQRQMTEGVLASRRFDARAFSGVPEGEASLVVTFIQTVPLMLYRRWVAEGKPVTPERLADMACALVLNGARGLARDAGRVPESREGQEGVAQ